MCWRLRPDQLRRLRLSGIMLVPIDLLTDEQLEAVAQWLEKHAKRQQMKTEQLQQRRDGSPQDT